MSTQSLQRHIIPFAAALFIALTALGFYRFFALKEDTNLQFYGSSTIEQVKALAAGRKKAFIVLEDRFAERGRGHFFTAKIESYPTECGDVDVRLSFFNNQLYYLALENVPETKNIPRCSKQQQKHVNGNITIRGKAVSYSNPAIEEKLDRWIRKWS